MMTVTIDINGRQLHRVEVVNRGPISGVYEDGDGPGGGGLRVYEWRHCGDGDDSTGRTLAFRSDGAVVLARLVLQALERVRLQDEADDGAAT